MQAGCSPQLLGDLLRGRERRQCEEKGPKGPRRPQISDDGKLWPCWGDQEKNPTQNSSATEGNSSNSCGHTGAPRNPDSLRELGSSSEEKVWGREMGEGASKESRNTNTPHPKSSTQFLLSVSISLSQTHTHRHAHTHTTRTSFGESLPHPHTLRHLDTSG